MKISKPFQPLLWILLIVCSVVHTTVSAEELSTQDISPEQNYQENFDPQPFTDGVYYLRDASHELTIGDIQNTPLTQWEKVHPKWLNLGVVSDSVWVKVELPRYEQSVDRIFEVANHNITELTFFLVKDNESQKILKQFKVGSHLTIRQRPLANRNYLFPMTIPGNTQTAVYLKVDSSYPVRLPISLWDKVTFSEVNDSSTLIDGIYIGLAGIMVLYNLCIYFFSRDSSYATYAAFMVFLTGYVATDKGLALQYLWPNTPGIDFQMTLIFTAIGCAISIPFTISFLSLKTHAPQLIRWFTYLFWIWVAIAIAAVVYPGTWLMALSLIVLLPGGTSLLVAGVLMWRKGVPAAKFYVIAWLALISCTGIYDMLLLGFYPINVITTYSLQFGNAVEITLFSLGLAYRIKSLDQEKQKANTLTEAKSEFLATMSHEIRTPMNGILGMAEMLKETQLSKQQTSYLSTILSAGQTLMTVLNDILDYSKIEAGKLELESVPYNFRRLIDETASVFSVKASEKQLFYTVYMSVDVPAIISGDPTRTRQVLSNFISNAFKFTQSGQVTINVEKLKSRNQILVRVEDSGIGIAEDKLASVFEKFTQADNSITRQYGGTGLGLPISKKFIELMGGKIGVNSYVGEGSTFWFTIPIKDEVPFNQIENPIILERSKQQNYLILTPDPLFKKQMEEYQQVWHFNLQHFKTISDAFENLRDTEVSFNFIYVDHYCEDFSEDIIISSLSTQPWALHSQLILSLKVGTNRTRLETITPAPFIEEYPISITQIQLKILKSMGLRFEEDPEEHTSIDFSQLHILVVDDNQVNSLVISGFLKRLGITPQLASNGKEAIEAVCSTNQHFDLIFMDCEMPVMDGYQATKLIRQWEQERSVKSESIICALSAHAMDSYKDRCFDNGMNDFLAKPIVFAKLKEILTKYHPEFSKQGTTSLAKEKRPIPRIVQN